ncbi:MAG TPA: glycosyltransferase family 4 protein [Candidatus Omnitrophota bacterium]|jgi:phosphatidylinositol alpha-1,6-mannosyltransferase|nr:glycosyltransferase family 4 protein [Candidatus Omnitrophota bacterium]
MKILFISRAYPPSAGGIENQNYKLSIWLSRSAQTTVIVNKLGKIFLPVFIPYSFIRSLILQAIVKYDVIILGDGVLSVLGWALKLFMRTPVICIVHGLDITYKGPLYQRLWVGVFLKKVDKLMAVSNATIKAGTERGIAPDKFVFIPNGVDSGDFDGIYGKKELAAIIGDGPAGKKVLLSLGRLIKRKGVSWFIRNVMQKLDEGTVYVIAGSGPDEKEIRRAAADTGLGSRITLLGRISEADKKVLLNTCDIFIQPNIKIDGDMEGFGISVLEAACCGKPVIASKLEGLQDAIKDGINGFFVEPLDQEGFAGRIKELLGDEQGRAEAGERAKAYVIENCNWQKISGIYLDAAGGILRH